MTTGYLTTYQLHDYNTGNDYQHRAIFSNEILAQLLSRSEYHVLSAEMVSVEDYIKGNDKIVVIPSETVWEPPKQQNEEGSKATGCRWIKVGWEVWYEPLCKAQTNVSTAKNGRIIRTCSDGCFWRCKAVGVNLRVRHGAEECWWYSKSWWLMTGDGH